MTDDELMIELEREAEYLDRHGRPMMAQTHRMVAARLRMMGQDARVGALVRRIREHPMVQRDGSAALLMTAHGTDDRDYWLPHFDGLTAALAHLDSLLSKEPEVVTGPSGRQYRRRDDGVIETRHRTRHTLSEWCNWLSLCETILVSDAPVVAALMEGK